MRRILIVSNRLPISVIKRKGKLNYVQSAGGLATGLSSLGKSFKSIWIGWPGLCTNKESDIVQIEEKFQSENMKPVFLSKYLIEKYYEGFSNKTIWPQFHYFTVNTIYDNHLWETYRSVNEIFCDNVLEIAKPDDIIWIHDYQLMLLPGLIREKLPDTTIGFFLHIPFPSYEIYRSLPWRKEILSGILGADTIGFHTYDYVRHFFSAVTRLLGIEHTLGKLFLQDRIIKVDSFPMGIDFNKFANASKEQLVKKEINIIKKRVKDRRIILSIDRLDYTKAIPQRLKAFDLFLKENSEFRGKIKLVLVVIPSRSKVPHYKLLKEEVDELVGRINGTYGSIEWTPIWYMYRNTPFPLLTALYKLADVALVTPFRDGMNLIAKEYVATNNDNRGVLILSEMAGAAHELGEAMIINPNDIDNIKDALLNALTMPIEDQIKHNQDMQDKLKRYNVERWADDFIDIMLKTKKEQYNLLTKHITAQVQKKIADHYTRSSCRLLFLDYDGTLKQFSKHPQRAYPDNELLELLEKLTNDPNNEVIIISGRDKETLQKWLGHLHINLIAEHGAWLRSSDMSWDIIEPIEQSWKNELLPILELFVDRTPDSFIEHKEFSLVWHYRKTDPGLGEIRARELVDTLLYLTSNLDLQVLEGSKVIEVKNSGINKGKAALNWLSKDKWDFLLAIGDDWTDEDLFKVMPENTYSIKVGSVSSVAKYKIKSVTEVRNLLKKLGDIK